MRRYQNIISLLVFIILIGLSFNSLQNPFVMNHIETFSFVDVSKTESSLYKEIQDKSKVYNEKPDDAYIDKVWKKTPGRNGVTIDIEKSYEQMKENGERSEEHTSELQSRGHLVCRLLLEKKKKKKTN